MSEYEKPVPRVRDLTQPFWEGCKRHQLLVQRCSQCQVFRFPPQVMCSQCTSLDHEWAQVSGRGRVYSYTIPSRTSPGELPAKGFEYPYAVVLIELPDAGGVRLVSNLLDCPIGEIEIGMEVDIVFDDVTDDLTLPKFTRR